MCRHEDHHGMVQIPAGRFLCGTDQLFLGNEQAPQLAHCPSFLIDIFPVTNAEFEKFKPRHVRSVSSPDDDMPVVDVTWWEALAYCHWLGKRLPTEMEWEKAARGPKGYLYSYGPEYVLGAANVWPAAKQATPVSAHAPNGYGLYDMSGNVWEYTADVYRQAEFKFCVIRGGSWGSCEKGSRTTTRVIHDLVIRNNRIGFRCACGSRLRRQANNKTRPRAFHKPGPLSDQRQASGLSAANLLPPSFTIKDSIQ